MYYKVLDNGLVVKNPIIDDAPALEFVQRACYPTLAENEIMAAEHFRSQINIFPEGQVAIFDGDKLVASATALLYTDIEHDHTFLESSGNLYLTTHEPDGEWLYGIDMGVLPEYRGRGFARILYRARHALVHELGIKGQAIAGMIPGFAKHKDQYSLDEYYQKVINKEIWDPTSSTQMRMGFQPLRLIRDYLDDPSSGNASIMMILPAETIV
jgi:GNAT superfamily N-acetyltransferase